MFRDVGFGVFDSRGFRDGPIDRSGAAFRV